MRRFPIRFKLLAALALPVVILLLMAVTQVVQVRGESQDAEEQAELALVADGPGSLFDALQAERTLAYFALIGLPPEEFDVAISLDEARVDVDESLDAFRSFLAGRSNPVQDVYAPAVEAFATLDAIREETDGYSGPRSYASEDFAKADESFDAYSDVIAQLTDANVEVMLAIEEPELRTGVELGRIASRQGDLIAQLTMRFLTAIVEPEVLRTQMVDIARMQGELETNDDMARSLATGPYSRFVEHLDASASLDNWRQIVRDSLESGEYDLEEAEALWDGDNSTPGGQSLERFRQGVAEELRRQADQVRSDAASRERLSMGLGLLGVLAAGGAVWLASWSVTRRLKTLTSEAADMASEGLPTAVQQMLETPLGQDVVVPSLVPIATGANDEIEDIADALNDVQESALNLAAEQAMIRRNLADGFANLGLRNQELVGRQLDFVTELEHQQADPDTLANLFHLDHLATRMRRNAESLLVLAGIDPPRKRVALVRLTDVIRAALSEIEDYKRVEVQDVGPVHITGTAAADLAHILAELLENALTFSPTTQNVEVAGRTQPVDGYAAPAAGGGPAAPGYLLAITDTGKGMHPHEIELANRRLAGAESFTVAPSEYLGHYIAGMIAARHGITIELRRSTSPGMTAIVTLPANLITTGKSELPPAPTARSGWAPPAPAPQA